MVKRLVALGIVAIGDTPEKFASIIRAEQVKYANLVKASGLKVDERLRSAHEPSAGEGASDGRVE